MAKLTYGPIVSDARNKVAGVVFSRSRSGPYGRSKVSPTQPRTTYQSRVRANFAGIAKSWSADLDDNQRAAWTALAHSYPVKDVFGNSRILTGLQMFMRVNRNLQVIGEAALFDAPSNMTVENLLTATLDASTPTIAVLTACAVTDDEAVYAYSSFTGGAPEAGMRITITGFIAGGGQNNGTFLILSSTGGASGTFTVKTTTQADETHAGSGTAVGLSITFTATPLGANAHLVVAACPQASPGRSAAFGAATTIKAFTATTTSPQSILAEYQAKYGTLTSGRKIKAQVYIIDDVNGAASLPMATIDTVS